MSSSFSKCVKSLSKRNRRASVPGDGTADAGQMMELSESAGESRFAALVRSRDDKDPLGVFQIKVIRHDA